VVNIRPECVSHWTRWFKKQDGLLPI